LDIDQIRDLDDLLDLPEILTNPKIGLNGFNRRHRRGSSRNRAASLRTRAFTATLLATRHSPATVATRAPLSSSEMDLPASEKQRAEISH
jgi:hypothetical protein